jgi:hypothetical protein
MHHLMMEFYSLDDVGQSYEIAEQEGRVAVKFGRHPKRDRSVDLSSGLEARENAFQCLHCFLFIQLL